MAVIIDQSVVTSGLSHWFNYSDIGGLNFTDVDYNNNLSSSNSNASSSLATDEVSLSWEDIAILVFKAMIMGSIIIVALMGNALVIVSISLNRKLQVMTNFFIVSLAIADMLVALCAMTFNASVELSGKWLFGYIMCDLYNSFDVYFSTVSILHLCCISMDRYYAILNPLEYPVKVTKRIILITLAHVWILPTLISFLPIFMGWYTTSNHLEDRSNEIDSCSFEVNYFFAILSSTVSFWFPCTVMVILYYRIFQEARKQETAIMSRTNSMSTLHNINRGISPTLTIRRLIARIRARKSALYSNRPKPKQEFPMCPLSLGCHNRGRNRTQSIYSTTSEMQVPCSLRHGQSPCMCSYPDGRLPPPPCIITEAEDDHISTTSQVASIHGTLMARDLKDASPDDNRESSIVNGRSSEASCPSLSSGLLPSSTRASGNCNQLMIPNSNHMGAGVPTMRREHKAAKTLGIIMGAFILCWLPFFTWYVTVTICGDACPCPKVVITMLFWIGYFNSTLNPFIYAYFRRDFREAFKKTLRRLQCCYTNDYNGRNGAFV